MTTHRPTILLLAVLLAAVGAPSPAAAKKATACNGRYLIDGSLVPGSGVAIDVVSVDGRQVAVASGCAPVRGKVGAKRKATSVAARWSSCNGLVAKVRLKAKIGAPDCSLMAGRFRAKSPKLNLRFTASRSICGDGVTDPGLGEACDGGTCADGQTCSNACTCDGGPGAVLNGALAVPSAAEADLDTADPAMQGDNDTIATAQDVPLFGTVGGAAYIASASDFDIDVYRIELDGEPLVISLAIADPDHSDLDLFLVDADGNDLVPPSTGVENYEQLVTTGITGTAFIAVVPYDSGTYSATPWTPYVLSVGLQSDGMATNIPADAEFVPGEVVVRLRGTLPAIATGRLALANTDAALVAGDPRESSGGLFHLPLPAATAQATAAGDDRAATIAAIRALRKRSDVVWAEPNYIRHPLAIPNDPFYSLQWHYPLIALPEAWDLTTGNANVIVAVIDTGQLFGHPDFAAGRFVPGYDFIANASSARDGNGIDADPFDNGDLGSGGRSSFHGTHVAGTIGAATNNGTGVSGIDWTGRLMPLRVLGQGGGTTYDIAQAIRFAAALSNDSGTVPAQRADIINMSLGGPGSDNTGRAAVQAARAAGVTVVVAAGNSNQDAAGFSPANFPEVVTVSATDLRREKAPYSNFGTTVDVAAPGGDTSVDRNGDGYVDGVLSTLADDSGGAPVANYTFYQGTSMASPHMAGVAALMQAAYQAANGGAHFGPEQLDIWLASGAITDALGPDNWSGHGLINARRAVEVAGGDTANLPPALTTIPTSVGFGADLTQATLLLRNAGSGALTVTGATSSEPWLTITPSAALPAAVPVDLVLTANRSGLAAGGSYSATVTVTSSAGSRDVPIALQVPLAGGGGGGDVGQTYVLLVDPVSNDTVAQATSRVADGYPIVFASTVPPGVYILVAGTDRDNDGIIGDGGEAFGAYPTATEPATLDLQPGATVTVGLPVIEEVGILADGTGFSRTPRQVFRRLR
ncbi:MAG TPA: S8 family serine peptidase [Candidatus Binatia bacterium]|jgi:serine protease|nr:S8 family serine peptidase [Candidatus Binatia bacterium]